LLLNIHVASGINYNGFKRRKLEGVGWIHLAHDMKKWRAAENTAMKSGVLLKDY
jgi:hypothetical protein